MEDRCFRPWSQRNEAARPSSMSWTDHFDPLEGLSRGMDITDDSREQQRAPSEGHSSEMVLMVKMSRSSHDSQAAQEKIWAMYEAHREDPDLECHLLNTVDLATSEGKRPRARLTRRTSSDTLDSHKTQWSNDEEFPEDFHPVASSKMAAKRPAPRTRPAGSKVVKVGPRDYRIGSTMIQLGLDVTMCGKGGHVITVNKFFKQLIADQYRPAYYQTDARGRTEIVHELFDYIKSQGGRFLDQSGEDISSYDKVGVLKRIRAAIAGKGPPKAEPVPRASSRKPARVGSESHFMASREQGHHFTSNTGDFDEHLDEIEPEDFLCNMGYVDGIDLDSDDLGMLSSSVSESQWNSSFTSLETDDVSSEMAV